MTDTQRLSMAIVPFQEEPISSSSPPKVNFEKPPKPKEHSFRDKFSCLREITNIGTKQWRYYDFGPKAVTPLICLPGTTVTADVCYKHIMALSMKVLIGWNETFSLCICYTILELHSQINSK